MEIETAALMLAYGFAIALIIGGAIALWMSRRRRSQVVRDATETVSAYADAVADVGVMPDGPARIRAERVLTAVGAGIDQLIPDPAAHHPPQPNLNNW